MYESVLEGMLEGVFKGIYIPQASKVPLVSQHSAEFRPRRRCLLDTDLSRPSPDAYGQS